MEATPAISQLFSCDWGDCDEVAVGYRNDALGHGWLPVCAGHYDNESNKSLVAKFVTQNEADSLREQNRVLIEALEANTEFVDGELHVRTCDRLRGRMCTTPVRCKEASNCLSMLSRYEKRQCSKPLNRKGSN